MKFEKFEMKAEVIKKAGQVSELSRKWLLRMLENEIAEVEGAISNELVWMTGADDEFTTELHCRNIMDLSKYKLCLQALRDMPLEVLEGLLK